MKLLAINTAFNQSYVSLLNDDCKYVKSVDSSLKQSENILGIVSDVFDEAKLKVFNLDAIACVVGPGSFTGIRIGVGLCKGFCVACKNIKKIQINSLDLLAFAYSKKAKQNFNVVLNALSGNLFVCKYNKGGKRLCEPYLLTQELQPDCEVVGLKEENLDFCSYYEEFTSSDLLNYATMLFNANEFSENFIPVYLRKSQAEAELDKKPNNQT